MNKLLIIKVIILTCLNTFGQKGNISLIKEYEDTLKIIAHEMMYADIEKDRRIANNGFITNLNEVLQYEKSFKFPFDSLKTISIVESPDKKFRIFTWFLEKDNETYEYYGIVHYYNRIRKKYEIITLTDKSNEIRNPEQADLDAKKWYGGVIYDIIYIKTNGRKYYTLLLWDGNNRYSTKKMIDIMYFSGNNKIKFGLPIFRNIEKNTKKRVIMEYDSKTSFSIKYDEQRKQIIFDNLVASNKELEGLYEYYTPEGTFNGYTYKNGKWLLEEDVDARSNEKLKKHKKSRKGLFPR